MCTVTVIPRKQGYLLAMNRDEQLTRAQGLPPVEREFNGCRALYPSEPGGGTWIALNAHGACLALINWYSVTARLKQNSISRGEVIPALITVDTPELVDYGLAGLQLDRTNPFRLIGVFPFQLQIVEWRWNLRHLVRKRHSWRTQQWISSGFDEPTAQKVRHLTFRKALSQKSAGTIPWLRRLHRSHAPEIGPFSTCMHRHDAATVSYTEVSVLSKAMKLGHTCAAPCSSSSRFQCVVSIGSRKGDLGFASPK